MKAARAFILPCALGGGAEHWPRQIDAEYIPALPRKRDGVPASAATQVEQARLRKRNSSSAANRNRTAFGADWAKPATVPGALHDESARGSIAEP